MMDSIQSVYTSTLQKMQALYPAEEAKAIADRLFEHYFQFTPSQRVLAGKLPVDSDKISILNTDIEKLLNHVPLQYVLGIAYFMDLELEVNPSVLIPRPETEEFVDRIVKMYSNQNTGNALNILDIGTGSGCIAIALKRYLQHSRVTAVDISQEALDVAKHNAAMNKEQVSFLKTNILDRSQWELLPQSDLIISNPPYVTDAEKQFMMQNVIDFEPHTALFVPDDDPLLFYKAILAFSKIKLSPGGNLWFEINEKFGNQIREAALKQGFRDINIIFDFRGKSRFLHASN